MGKNLHIYENLFSLKIKARPLICKPNYKVLLLDIEQKGKEQMNTK